MTTVASLLAQQIEVAPGNEAVCQMEIRNTGPIVESYELSILGESAAWARIEPPVISLVPGDSATVAVVFGPPRSSAIEAGEIAFGVQIAPSTDASEGAVPEGVVTVLPFAESGAELRPSTSAGRGGARHEVAIDNRGNTALSAEVLATDPDDKLRLTAIPPTVSVGAGHAQFVRVKVKHRKRLWRGQPVTRRFQVKVNPDNGPPISLDGSTVQLPVFSQAITRGLAALLLLALLTVGLWYGLVRPAIKSEATNRANEAVAKQMPNRSGAGAAPDTKSQEESVTPSPTPPLLTPPSPPSAGTIPLKHRFQIITGANTTGSSTKLQAEPNKTLVITDIFLQSPQGDVGRLDIMIDEAETFTYGTQNYRNYDEHLVSPIEIAVGGQSIWARVRCTKPGESIAPFAAGDAKCRSWVTVVGYVRTAPATP